MATTAAVFFLKFTIIPKSLEDDDVTVTFSPESSYYTGQPITPDVTVKFGNIDLVRDRDYTLEWEDNTDAGTATVSVKAYSDNYTDTKTAEFTILAAPASGKVTITGADNKVGTELTASVTGNTHILFQFTPLREGRQGQCLPDAPGYCISIHAPARGATVLRGKRDGRGKISIHAPARGATAAPQLFCDFVVYFNSRPCERGDSPRRKWGVNLEYFNSRPCERGDSGNVRTWGHDANFNSRPCERGDSIAL